MCALEVCGGATYPTPPLTGAGREVVPCLHTADGMSITPVAVLLREASSAAAAAVASVWLHTLDI